MPPAHRDQLKIYRLDLVWDDDGNNPYETLSPEESSFDFDMTRKREDARHWLRNPIRGEWCGEGLPIADYSSAAIAGDVLSQRAVDALRDVLDLQRGELYPLEVRDSKALYWIYRIWERFNALDMPIPKVLVDQVKNPVFLPNVAPPAIFKSQHETERWVTQDFVDRVEEAGLTGFDFQYVGETG